MDEALQFIHFTLLFRALRIPPLVSKFLRFLLVREEMRLL